MEIISSLLLAISPFVVSGITQLVKFTETAMSGGFRTTIIRFGVALLSFGTVIGTASLNNSAVDMVSIETFTQAFLVFIGATGVYFWNKYRKVTA